jgi:hypothetical protein
MYGHFLLLMIFVLVLVMAVAYFGYLSDKARAQQAQREKGGEAFDDDAPAPTVERRVAQVIYAMHETAASPVMNSKDVNTIYQLWYGNMHKQGVPADIYIRADVFRALYDLVQTSTFTPDNVQRIVAPLFHQEAESGGKSVQEFRPVCLNY